MGEPSLVVAVHEVGCSRRLRRNVRNSNLASLENERARTIITLWIALHEKRVIVDLNVILDVLENRDEWVVASARVCAICAGER